MKRTLVLLLAIACVLPAHAAKKAYTVSAEAGVLSSSQPGGSAY
jgi:hypothetical protein